MNNVKEIRKRIILTIILSLIILLIFPIVANATEITSTTSVNSIKSLPINSSVYVGSERSLFSNNRVFCCYTGQGFYGNKYYNLSTNQQITESSNNVLQGLAYILSQNKTSVTYYDEWFFNDPLQIALWGYIKKYEDKLPNGMHIGTTVTVDTANGRLNVYTRGDSAIYGTSTIGNKEKRQIAYDIYQKALNVAQGKNPEGSTKTKVYTGTICIFTHNESQNFIFGEGKEEIISPVVKIQLKKIDSATLEAIGATAEFTVIAENNCIFNKQTLETDANGETNVVKIEPVINNGTLKVTIDETKVPSEYKSPGQKATVIINYNTSTGEVKSITSNNDYFSFEIVAGTGIGVIKIKNDKLRGDVNLKIIKQNETGAALNGVKFKIISGANILSTAIKEHTTNSSGEINISKIVSDKDKEASFTIQETATAPGYKLYNTPITIKYTPEVGDNFSVSASIEKNSEFLGVSKSGNTIVLKYANLKNNQIIIHKTDESGNPLAGVKFRITLNLVRSVIVNGTKVQYSNANNNYTGQLILDATTDTNGYIILSEIEAFCRGDYDMDGMITVSNDAPSILKVATKIIKDSTENQKKLADVDNNGIVESEDSRLILRDFAGLESLEYIDISGTIHETQALSGYNTCADTTFSMNYQNSTKSFQIGTISEPGVWESNSNTIKIIKIKNYKNYPKELVFKFLKLDGSNKTTKLKDAEFEFYITNSSDKEIWKSSNTYITDKNGEITVKITDETKIKELCNEENLRIHFHEIKTPVGYKTLYPGWSYIDGCKTEGTEIISKYSWENNGCKIVKNSNVYTIYNDPSLIFEFLKLDGTTKEPLKGAGFKFYITTEGAPDTKLWGPSTEYMTGSDGKIVVNIRDAKTIETIVNASKNGNLRIYFQETTTPAGYTSIYGDKWNYRTCKIKGTEMQAALSYKNDDYEISLGSIVYTIYNHKKINIGGYVWLDGQTGIKPVNSPNGVIDDSEIGVKGVKVELFNSSNELVGTTTTDASGYYSFKIAKGTYKVRFTYEGINYERTIDGSSKATENGRSTFNNKFKTIPNNETLEYEADTEKGTSTLITGAEKIENSEGITALDMTNVQENFKMTATTAQTSYTQDTYNINFGLVRRGVDLSLATDVYSATVSINGKEKIYSDYNTNLAGIVLDPEREDRVIYNLNLYNSDYNYRLEDYFSEGLNDDIEEIDEAKNESPELNVDVTYAIYINNQSENTAYVNSIVDYFDTNYSFKDYRYVKYDSSGETEITGEILATIDGTAKINEITYNKITFSGLNVEDLKDGEQNILYVTFTVNKDENENVVTGDFKNIAEITSYSTDNGCVDKDSAPGNITTNFKEDDTDEAGGINIRIGGESRSITGYVWEDKDKNGKKDNNDETVSDVMVQLIELKDLTIGTDKYYFEYIWQETLSGSDTVYTIDRTEPNKIKEYKTEKAEGKYTFTGFIPGDYVIRFIYGDGTTATYDMTGNMINYNGQDYKSTKDPAYNQEWYLESNYNVTESVARDNEARRLKVMSFSTLVDNEKGMLLKLLNNPEITDLSDTEKTILVSAYNKIYDPDITEFKDADKEKLLKEQVLENTWMNADTSKVDVPVDNNNTSGDNSLSYENMNFGLTLRPVNKLTLEKHVSSMKIVTTGIGTSSITDASLVDEKLQGLRKGLIADIATRTTRGFWKLETDIEELLQGATLEVTYNYTVKQDGDNDYLSQNLANAYKKICEKGKITWGGNDYTDYSQLLSDIASVNEPIGTYLSDAYYTGNTGTNTLSRVESIEDYYEHESKDLIFNEEKNTDFAITNKNDDGKIKPANENAYTISNGASSKTNSYTINKVIASVPTKVLNVESTDTKTVKVSKVLSSYNTEDDLKFDSNIAQIVAYSTATGRRDMESTPGNLDYIYSEDSDKGLNELDEFWAEPITITKSTGENKVAITTIVIIATTALAVIGIAAITIKKYVLIKKH